MELNSSPEIQITFGSADKSAMQSGEDAHIFRFDVTNLCPKQSKLFVSPSVYTTQVGEEIDQDSWLSGLGNGVGGFALNSGTFKKIGCVYFNSKLLKLTTGDKILLTAWIDAGSINHEFIFECVDAYSNKFELLSSSLEPRIAEESESVFEITNLVERLELIEEKFGISIDGLYAKCKKETRLTPHYFEVNLNFDLTGTRADFEQDFTVRLNAYNAEGQLLGTTKSYVYKDIFIGFKSEVFTLHVDQRPARLRLYPAAI